MSQSKFISLESLLERSEVTTLDTRQTEEGLIFVEVSLGGKSGKFLIDTGATKSAIFENSDIIHMENVTQSGVANVFGLIYNGSFPLVRINGMKLDQLELGTMTFAVLPERQDVFFTGVKIDGILGMDFLKDFRVFIQYRKQRISFIPMTSRQPDIIQSWTPVELFSNPFDSVATNLHFFSVRIGAQLMPALMDTGADFNVINWNAVTIPELKRLRRKLQKDWEIQGAVSKFKPEARITANEMRSGRMKWAGQMLVVLDFNHLKMLGFGKEPFVIAGAPLFAGHNIYIDFSANKFWVDPGEPTP